MIGRHEHDSRRQKHIIPHRDTVAGVDDTVGIDVTVLAHAQIPASTIGANAHEVINLRLGAMMMRVPRVRDECERQG